MFIFLEIKKKNVHFILQLGFTSPTQAAITKDLNLTVGQVKLHSQC
jgi:hypothetical protein